MVQNTYVLFYYDFPGKEFFFNNGSLINKYKNFDVLKYLVFYKESSSTVTDIA